MVGRQNADIADNLQLRHLQSPTYRFSDSGRLLYFGRVIYFFSIHRFFDIPGPIFAKLCYTTRCVLKYFVSYMGDPMCPLKNLRGEKTLILAIFGSKIDTLSPPFLIRGILGNLKQ